MAPFQSVLTNLKPREEKLAAPPEARVLVNPSPEELRAAAGITPNAIRLYELALKQSKAMRTDAATPPAAGE